MKWCSKQNMLNKPEQEPDYQKQPFFYWMAALHFELSCAVDVPSISFMKSYLEWFSNGLKGIPRCAEHMCWLLCLELVHELVHELEWTCTWTPSCGGGVSYVASCTPQWNHIYFASVSLCIKKSWLMIGHSVLALIILILNVFWKWW